MTRLLAGLLMLAAVSAHAQPAPPSGPIGPQGPAGPAGSTGPAGAAGASGPGYTAKAPVALTFGSTVTIDASQGQLFTLTATGNFTLTCPTNMATYYSYQVQVTQDGTGGRVITKPACLLTPAGGGITLSTTGNAVDVITFTSFNGSTADATISKAFQ